MPFEIHAQMLRSVCQLRTQRKPRLCLKLLSSSLPVMLLHFVNCLWVPLTLLVNVRWKRQISFMYFPVDLDTVSSVIVPLHQCSISVFFKVNMHTFLDDFVSPFCLYNRYLLYGLLFSVFPIYPSVICLVAKSANTYFLSI